MALAGVGHSQFWEAAPPAPPTALLSQMAIDIGIGLSCFALMVGTYWLDGII
jgi:hypothetical protein